MHQCPADHHNDGDGHNHYHHVDKNYHMFGFNFSSNINISSNVNISRNAHRTHDHVDLMKWHGTEIIFVSSMIFIGFIGNSLVAYVYTFRSPTDPMALTKKWLSAFDLAFLVVSMPMYLYLVVEDDTEYYVWICRTLWYIALSCVISSVQVLIVIAIDRYLKLCLVRIVGITEKDNQKLMVFSVGFSGILNIPVFWLFGCKYVAFDDAENHHICFVADGRHNLLFGFWTFVLTAYFITALSTLVFLYVKIMKKLQAITKIQQSYRKRPSVFSKNEINKSSMHNRRLEAVKFTTVLFIAITVVFFFSYTPFLVSLHLELLFMGTERKTGPVVKGFQDICKLSLAITHVANPFIYSLVNNKFRDELKGILILQMVDAVFHTPDKPFGVHNSAWGVSSAHTDVGRVEAEGRSDYASPMLKQVKSSCVDPLSKSKTVHFFGYNKEQTSTPPYSSSLGV